MREINTTWPLIFSSEALDYWDGYWAVIGGIRQPIICIDHLLSKASIRCLVPCIGSQSFACRQFYTSQSVQIDAEAPTSSSSYVV